ILRCVDILTKPAHLKQLSKIERLSVLKFKKEITKERKLPAEHIEKFSKLIPESEAAWEKAKAKSNFSIFRPYLEKCVQLSKQSAAYIDPKMHPYDVFLDDFEEGMTVVKLKKIFAELKAGLIEIITHIKKSNSFKRQKNVLKDLDFPIDDQDVISEEVMDMILEDEGRSVIAESVHPFTDSISADDVRITTAFREKDPMFSFTSTAHESGHALYELGFSRKLENTILFDAPSTGLHESQSRFWENHIFKSYDFWRFFYPHYQKVFGKALSRMKLGDFFKQMNQVRESKIRIEADEVTYCLHVIIRFELEVELFEGSLKVKDLPKAWNQKYKEYLGVSPRNDSEGVLQDTHWSGALFGYFPTYALGTMYSAMIYNQMRKDIKGFDGRVRKGDFSAIRKWLKKNVHEIGSTMLADDVIKRCCGRGLTATDYLEYLKGKYYGIYDK
ncbi:MAG: carboxypeptidase M32, partial [Candidatus Woesearchaeota archaeon]|nr:carboxypeptidase M32 [Candidatus Woesearchaeota archaeon]